MIVFNTTFNVERSLKDEFIEYMLQKFIPDSTRSGILKNARLAQVFGSNEEEGLSFALEFTISNVIALEKWNSEESNAVYAPLLNKFKEKITGFSTLLQVIEY